MGLPSDSDFSTEFIIGGLILPAFLFVAIAFCVIRLLTRGRVAWLLNAFLSLAIGGVIAYILEAKNHYYSAGNINLMIIIAASLALINLLPQLKPAKSKSKKKK
jgi:uncharacterized membrane protein YhaH (DUF805 family)